MPYSSGTTKDAKSTTYMKKKTMKKNADDPVHQLNIFVIHYFGIGMQLYILTCLPHAVVLESIRINDVYDISFRLP